MMCLTCTLAKCLCSCSVCVDISVDVLTYAMCGLETLRLKICLFVSGLYDVFVSSE